MCAWWGGTRGTPRLLSRKERGPKGDPASSPCWPMWAQSGKMRPSRSCRPPGPTEPVPPPWAGLLTRLHLDPWSEGEGEGGQREGQVIGTIRNYFPKVLGKEAKARKWNPHCLLRSEVDSGNGSLHLSPRLSLSPQSPAEAEWPPSR